MPDEIGRCITGLHARPKHFNERVDAFCNFCAIFVNAWTYCNTESDIDVNFEPSRLV